MRRTLVMLLALALLAAACAPTTAGGAGNPINLQRQTSATTLADSSVFVRTSYALEAFRLTTDDFASSFVLPMGTRGSTRRVTSDFELRDVRAPEGWSWRLETVMLETLAGRSPELIATLRLSVPPGTRPGGQQVAVDLVSRTTGARQRVELVVQVIPR